MAERHVRQLEEIARDLDLVVFRLERAAPPTRDELVEERARLRRDLDRLRQRLDDVVRQLDV